MGAPPGRLPVAEATVDQEEQVKSREEIMEILEAFDLTGSFRDAAELAGCSHHTVAAWVQRRERGELPTGEPVRRERIIDPFLAKIEEWVERSDGRIRADIAHAPSDRRERGVLADDRAVGSLCRGKHSDRS